MTTVREVFAGAGLVPIASVRWGQPAPVSGPGVYLVAMTPDIDDQGRDTSCPLDPNAVQALLDSRPEITVDGVMATQRSLSSRLQSMWPASEVVLYIGLAGSSLVTRIDQYYKTPLGARAPHAGGWPLKVLSNLQELWVHVSPCADPAGAEQAMIRTFADGVPVAVVRALCDPGRPIPFANLQVPGGARKHHGILGAKAARSTPRVVRSATVTVTKIARSDGRVSASGSRTQSQVVTAVDLANGRIRFPAGAKSAFPRDRGEVEIVLRGELMTCRWDPRVGPDKERSGVLSVPSPMLRRLVHENERLTVTSDGGRVLLD